MFMLPAVGVLASEPPMGLPDSSSLWRALDLSVVRPTLVAAFQLAPPDSPRVKPPQRQR
jgi:hypothetical protein